MGPYIMLAGLGVLCLSLVVLLGLDLYGDLHYWRISRKQRRLTKEYEARRIAHEVRR